MKHAQLHGRAGGARRALPPVLVAWFAAWALPLPTAGQAVPGAPATDWQNVQTEYRLTVLREYSALATGWSAAFGASDVAGLERLYSEHASLLLSGRTIAGRDSIVAFLGELNGSVQDIRIGLTDFVASDRLAYAAGAVHVSFRPRSPGPARSVVGQHVTVLVRDGRRWLIHAQVLQYEAQADDPLQ